MSWSDRYVGLGFLDHGRDWSGVDCWGLARLVLTTEWGIDLPSYAGEYVHHREHAEIAALIGGAQSGPDWMRVEDAQPFDLLTFRRGRLVTHVAVVVVPGKRLHVDSNGPSRIEPYDVGTPTLTGIWRHRNLQPGEHE